MKQGIRQREFFEVGGSVGASRRDNFTRRGPILASGGGARGAENPDPRTTISSDTAARTRVREVTRAGRGAERSPGFRLSPPGAPEICRERPISECQVARETRQVGE
uniref:Ring finger protein 34 n=1 Tax=Molossus molossus TaxID=27622 RepID=A0A7J8BZJ6_MOLMO|nr:ring finger protein 34 [Molossus molossus]